MDKKYTHTFFVAEEELNDIILIPYKKEVRFFNELSNGNEEFLEDSLRREPFYISTNAGFSVLSQNPVRNAKYHFYGTATLAARYCIQKGMSHHHALDLVSYYNQKLDLLETEDEIAALHAEMCMLMCQEMKEILKHKNHSKSIRQCLDYIYTHLRERVTIAEIGEYVQLSESHLSKKFKREMGVSLSEYILQQKIERAKNLLRYSELSIVEIGENFSFSSQSHFTRIFKMQTGVTPHKYRELAFHSKWDAPDSRPSEIGSGEMGDLSLRMKNQTYKTNIAPGGGKSSLKNIDVGGCACTETGEELK